MVLLTVEDEERIASVYFNPSKPGAYSSPAKIHKALKKRVSIGKIKKFLQTQESYTVLKQAKRKFTKSKVISPHVDYMWDADTANMTFYDKKDEKIAKMFNDGYRYFLVVIDVFSRFLWTRPLRSLKAEETTTALSEILNERKPMKLRTDLGSEFKNNKLRKVLQNLKVDHFFTLNEGKANYAERVIQTIKNKLGRYMEEKETNRWIDVLPQLTNGYNHTFHTSIKMKPANVTSLDEYKIWKLNHETVQKQKIKSKPKPSGPTFKLNEGDYVRLTGYKHPFQKSAFSHSWTTEIFIVVERRKVGGLAKYRVMDYAHEEVRGEFYEEELQKVYIGEKPSFKIEKVIKQRKRNNKKEYFVKFKSWPKKYNAWVKDLKKL
jgi:hypothetical protein